QRTDRRVHPALDQFGRSAPALSAEQARPVPIGILQIDGNRPAVADRAISIDKDRHRLAGIRRDGRDFGEGFRPAFEVEPLVLQRHADTPGIRAEGARSVGAAQLVKDNAQGFPPGFRIAVAMSERTLSPSSRAAKRRRRIGFRRRAYNRYARKIRYSNL